MKFAFTAKGAAGIGKISDGVPGRQCLCRLEKYSAN